MGPRHFGNEYGPAGMFRANSSGTLLFAVADHSLVGVVMLRAFSLAFGCLLKKAWSLHFAVDWWLSANINWDTSGKWVKLVIIKTHAGMGCFSSLRNMAD